MQVESNRFSAASLPSPLAHVVSVGRRSRSTDNCVSTHQEHPSFSALDKYLSCAVFCPHPGLRQHPSPFPQRCPILSSLPRTCCRLAIYIVLMGWHLARSRSIPRLCDRTSCLAFVYLRMFTEHRVERSLSIPHTSRSTSLP